MIYRSSMESKVATVYIRDNHETVRFSEPHIQMLSNYLHRASNGKVLQWDGKTLTDNDTKFVCVRQINDDCIVAFESVRRDGVIVHLISACDPATSYAKSFVESDDVCNAKVMINGDLVLFVWAYSVLRLSAKKDQLIKLSPKENPMFGPGGYVTSESQIVTVRSYDDEYQSWSFNKLPNDDYSALVVNTNLVLLYSDTGVDYVTKTGRTILNSSPCTCLIAAIDNIVILSDNDNSFVIIDTLDASNPTSRTFKGFVFPCTGLLCIQTSDGYSFYNLHDDQPVYKMKSDNDVVNTLIETADYVHILDYLS